MNFKKRYAIATIAVFVCLLIFSSFGFFIDKYESLGKPDPEKFQHYKHI